MKLIIATIAALAVSAAAQQPRQPDPPRDSRGYKVVSNPAQVPEGANRPVRLEPNPPPPPDPRVVFAPRPSPGNYPPCTREVTDNCKQVHERGVRPR